MTSYIDFNFRQIIEDDDGLTDEGVVEQATDMLYDWLLDGGQPEIGVNVKVSKYENGVEPSDPIEKMQWEATHPRVEYDVEQQAVAEFLRESACLTNLRLEYALAVQFDMHDDADVIRDKVAVQKQKVDRLYFDLQGRKPW